ncbi:MAG: esterase-like activity of phytase family protein [Erythrobacter sp.]
MRTGRLLALLIVALGLAPGVWLQTYVPPEADRPPIHVERLASPQPEVGRLRATGLWEISSAHPFFGGFSAMVYVERETGTDALLIGSDRGYMMELPVIGGRPHREGAALVDYWRKPVSGEPLIDLESMTRDPASGTLWTGYENTNTVLRERRRNQEQSVFARRAPPEMAGWRYNSGPETMERLADGRFLVIAEGRSDDADSDQRRQEALLFERDPVEPQNPLRFTFASPKGYAPVDATGLPDGRVLILLRRVRWGVPIQFSGAIMVADPTDIAPGEIWTGRIIARLDGPVLGENFEGIAFVAQASTNGPAGSIYVVADDNLSAFQRTLFLRLAWPAGGKR